MVQVGIIGLGFMAATHIKAYRQLKNARIVAVANPSGHRLDGDLSDVAGNIGGADSIRLDMQQVKAYRDPVELIADPAVQLVDICTPTHTHHDLALAALKAGKHLLCEKPLALTSPLARRIVEAAANAPGYAMPAMCLRFWPEWAWAKEAVAQNRFGRVLSARFRRVGQPPAWGQGNYFNGALSGGALLDLHIHDTDFVQYCFGLPQQVYSSGISKFSGAIDHVVTQYRVASEAVVVAEGGWDMAEGFGFNMAYTINFEEATLDYDLSRTEQPLRLYRQGHPPETILPEGPDGYAGETQYFVNCILDHQAPSIVTLEDGCQAVEICEAEQQSIQTGQPVSLAPGPRQ